MASDLIIRDHCVKRYRQRVGPKSLSDPECRRRIRLAINTGRRATARESRDILDASDQFNDRDGLWRVPQGRPAWYVISRDMIYVIGRLGRKHVAVTCWPSPLEGQGRKAA